MPKFYVLEIGGIAQYEFANYEVYGEAHYSDAPTCPECGRSLGMSRWEQPYDIKLEQSHKIGDFIDGYGGCDFIASYKVTKLAAEAHINGIERKFPIETIRRENERKMGAQERPALFGIDLVYSKTRVLYYDMEVEWRKEPAEDYCRVCGPGGGGKGGIYKKIDKVVIDESTLQGEDMFHPMNFSDHIILSQKAAVLIEDYELTNVKAIPCEEYRL